MESNVHLGRWKCETQVSIKKKSIKNNNFEQTQFNLVFIEVVVAYDQTKMGYLSRFCSLNLFFNISLTRIFSIYNIILLLWAGSIWVGHLSLQS